VVGVLGASDVGGSRFTLTNGQGFGFLFPRAAWEHTVLMLRVRSALQHEADANLKMQSVEESRSRFLHPDSFDSFESWFPLPTGSPGRQRISAIPETYRLRLAP